MLGVPGSSSFDELPRDRMEGRVWAPRGLSESETAMTDIVHREAELSFCLFTGNDQRGFILRPGDAT